MCMSVFSPGRRLLRGWGGGCTRQAGRAAQVSSATSAVTPASQPYPQLLEEKAELTPLFLRWKAVVVLKGSG